MDFLLFLTIAIIIIIAFVIVVGFVIVGSVRAVIILTLDFILVLVVELGLK